MSGQGLRLVGVLVGLAIPLFLFSLPSLFVLSGVALLALFTYLWAPLRSLSLVMLGFVFSCVHLGLLIDKQLPREYEGKDLRVSLKIESLPIVKERSTSFEAQIVDAEDTDWRQRLRLTWYHAPTLHVGDVWQLNVRLKRPRGFANGSGFDYQAWLLSQKIFATGYVRHSKSNNKLGTIESVFTRAIFESQRAHLDEQLLSARHYETTRFMRALLIGNKSGIHQQDWQILQATGTLHLMAISGLHIGLIATLGFILGRGLARLVVLIVGSRHGLFCISPLLSIIFAFIYAGFAGFSVPTQRALLFVLMVNAALVLGRRINYFYALLICAILIVAYDPFVFLAPGFYLSFCAVAVLFWCFMGRSRVSSSSSRGAWSFIQTQLVLFVGLFLPLSLLSLPISLAGLFTNMLAIPVVGFAVVPLLFLSSFIYFFSAGLSHFLLKIADTILSALWGVLQWFAELKFASFNFIAFGTTTVLAVCALTLVLLAPRAFALRLLCVPLFLLLLCLPPQKKEFELTVLDVGQGLAVFVTWPEGSLLYDTGARFSSDFDIGSRVIAPWLRNHGASKLDYLMVSHGDNDHAGGLEGVLANVSVASLWVGPNVSKSTLKKQAFDCNSQSIIQGGQLSIEVLWPLPRMKTFNNSNNASCVVLLRYANTQVLLAGDIEKEVEHTLVASGSLPRGIDVLIAPHHGSSSSSTKGFLQALQPKHVVFSVGYRNRYRHPHKKVRKRYADLGTQMYRTDADGAVRFTRNAEGELAVRRVRINTPRVWFW